MNSKIFREAALAYQAVYDEELRQEIEEQQDFENWVNSLVEEGYDLSEYTWEEIYETYITEIGVNFGGQAAVDKVRARASAERASAAKLDAARTQRFGRGGAPSAGKDSSGNLRKPVPTAPRPAPAARPSGGSSAPAARPSAEPPARPALTAAARPAGAPTAKPAPTAAAKPTTSASTAAPKPKTPNPLMQKTFGYQTGGAPDQVAKTAAPTPAAKPTPTPPRRPGGSVKPGSLVSSFDLFDVVKGYLIDEGFAETEEAATSIMANMSQEWRMEVIGEAEKWIQKAIKKPGALSKQLGVPENENIPAEKLAAAAKKGGKLGQRARLAQTLKKLN